eukprot:5245037-Prymnesium_polylepis.1
MTESREMTEAMLEAEREKRVAHLQEVAARRIGQMEIAKGWQAWLDVYMEDLRCRQLLKGCAVRMAKPKLVACWKAWYHSWDEEQRASVSKNFNVLLKEQMDLRKQVEEELRRVQMQLAVAMNGDDVT